MVIAEQVCSPEQAQFFDTVGLKLRTQFYWVCFYDTRLPREQQALPQWKAVTLDDIWQEYQGNPRYRELKRYRAYNATELGALLPWEVELPGMLKTKQAVGALFYGVYPSREQPYFVKYALPWGRGEVQKRGTTEAQARAAMLQYLLEKSIVAPSFLTYTSSNKETMGSTP